MLKILIVDDEELIRKGLIKIINESNGEFQVIAEAADGIEALAILKNTHPDVIITDIKMPEMNGIELIKQLELSFPDIKKVVISGFDEFNYVRETMKNGALDYLLKPIDDLQLVDLLMKIEQSIQKERGHKLDELNLKAKLDASLPFLKEQFFRELISEHKYSELELSEKLDYYDISINTGDYNVIIVSIDNHHLLYKALGAEEAKIKTLIIRNIIEESVVKDTPFLAYIDTIGIVLLISCPTGDQSLISKIVNNIFNNLYKNALGLKITISVGTRVECLLNLKESYNNAVIALKYRFYNDHSQIIKYQELKHFKNYDMSSSLVGKYQNQLEKCIEMVDYNKVEVILREFSTILKELWINPVEVMKMFVDIYIKLQSDFTEFEKAVVELNGFDYSYIKEIDSFDTCGELINYTWRLYSEAIKRVAVIRSRKDKKLVEIVKEYVLNHYYEDINLSKIAEITYVNPSYICDLYKNQTGENFIDFLTKVRIEKAKHLLKDVRIKTYEVGSMVGYNDPAYFSRVFKKVVGVTPSEYRNIIK